jgi:NAD-dependent dihydropyrimidine dehydrogenase PreA subunit
LAQAGSFGYQIRNKPMTQSKWFAARNKRRIGPVSFSRLRELAAAGKLLPTDMVLEAGAQKWTPAGSVTGIFAKPALAGSEAATSRPSCLGSVNPQAGVASRFLALAEAQVVPEAANCVQCGICSFNCPMGIDVRAHAWRGKPIFDSHCITCAECVNRCPRDVLRFERLPPIRSR